MIKRKYTQITQDVLRRSPGCVLIGPRQCGKTTIARNIVSRYEGAVYLDLENPRDVSKLEDSQGFFGRHSNSLVIIDEVQIKPELFRELRPAIDADRRPGRFLLLGSASPPLVQGVSESLTGRVEYIEITPFLLDELSGMQQAKDHLLRGGFPEALLAATNDDSLKWRSAYLKSYAQMEMSLIFGAGINRTTITNLWKMLGHLSGGLLNSSALASSLGVSSPTVKKYIHYLEGAFHVRLLQPWFVNAKKRLIKSPKVYVRDSGLLTSLLDIIDTEDFYGHPSAGAIWEGYATEQIIGSATDYTPYFYRTANGAEADLVLVKGLKPVLVVELKLSPVAVPTRGFYEAVNDLQPERAYVVSPAEKDTFTDKHGVTQCGLNDFLGELKKH